VVCAHLVRTSSIWTPLVRAVYVGKNSLSDGQREGFFVDAQPIFPVSLQSPLNSIDAAERVECSQALWIVELA
jgi:hypothetical protein